MALAVVERDPGMVLEDRGAELMGVINAATAGLVAVIADALATNGWSGWGIHTPEHWVGLRFGLSRARARRLVAAARALADLPQVRAAFDAGELSEDHIAEIARAQVSSRYDGQVAQLARVATIAQLRHALRWLPPPEPVPVEPDADEPRADEPDAKEPEPETGPEPERGPGPGAGSRCAA